MAVEREKRRNELFKYWKEKRPNTKEEGSKDRTCVSFVFFWGEGNYNFFFFLFVCVCVWQQEHSHRDGDGWNDCTGGQDLTGRCRRAAGSQRFRGGVGVGAPKSGSADFRRRLQLYTYIHTHSTHL
jgi:hypothetical protein